MRAGRLGCRGTGDELIEGFMAVITDVFVNGHEKGSKGQRHKAKKETQRPPYIITGEMGK